MKIKRWLGMLILTAWLSGPTAFAQTTSNQPIYPPPSPIDKNGEAVPPAEPPPRPPGVLSPWITYQRECCEGLPGKITPLFTELYVNAGPTFPIGGTNLSAELKTGWSFTGGARALFFNAPMTSAWAIDLHVMTTSEGAANPPSARFPVTIFERGTRSDFNASVHTLNRTSFGVGLGREWYLRRPATMDGLNWRFGIDVGARYGSERVAFNETGHLTDVVGSAYTSAHSDVECCLWGHCMFHAGLRLEWSYTWSDVLQRTSDSQDISLLFTIGIRY